MSERENNTTEIHGESCSLKRIFHFLVKLAILVFVFILLYLAGD